MVARTARIEPDAKRDTGPIYIHDFRLGSDVDNLGRLRHVNNLRLLRVDNLGLLRIDDLRLLRVNGRRLSDHRRIHDLRLRVNHGSLGGVNRCLGLINRSLCLINRSLGLIDGILLINRGARVIFPLLGRDRRADQGPGDTADNSALSPTVTVMAANETTGNGANDRPAAD